MGKYSAERDEIKDENQVTSATYKQKCPNYQKSKP